MGTHSNYYADAENAVVVVPKPRHPALGLEASRAWHAHSRAIELQGMAMNLAAEHALAVRHDQVTRRMRRSVVLLSLLALLCLVALVVASSEYGQQLNS